MPESDEMTYQGRRIRSRERFPCGQKRDSKGQRIEVYLDDSEAAVVAAAEAERQAGFAGAVAQQTEYVKNLEAIAKAVAR